MDKQERVGCIFAELARARDHLLSRVNVFVLHKPATSNSKNHPEYAGKHRTAAEFVERIRPIVLATSLKKGICRTVFSLNHRRSVDSQ
jgi:hypothetical protein